METFSREQEMIFKNSNENNRTENAILNIETQHMDVLLLGWTQLKKELGNQKIYQTDRESAKDGK